MVWCSTLLPEFYGAKRATKNLHPSIELSAENCTEQMGVRAPGTNGCLIFGWALPRAPAKNCNRNTCSRVSRQSRDTLRLTPGRLGRSKLLLPTLFCCSKGC